MERTSETLSLIIHQYLQRNNLHFDDSPSWEIKKSQLGGFGVFATRSLEVGEVIFKDHPIILGPRAALEYPLLCVNCYKKDGLKLCSKKCGLLLCSMKCQETSEHQKECKIIRQWQTQPIAEEHSEKIFKVLSPIRSLLLSEEDKKVVKCLKYHKSSQHGFEVDVMKNILHFNLKDDEEVFMRLVCSVLDANAFEVLIGDEKDQSSVKGLYPLGSLANHSCIPNTMHVFDDQQNMVVRATKFIPKGSELFHSYSRLIWGTPTRRYHLFRTKHFFCKCHRCEDPTELGSYMSALFCKTCKIGKVIPIQPLSKKEKWQCQSCTQVMKREDIAAMTSLLGSAINSFTNDDAPFMLRFLDKKLSTMVPPKNETIIELKYKLIWILGHKNGFTWKELPEKLLQLKQQFCYEILNLLEILDLGQCKMRGLLLYELYSCMKEIDRRNENTKSHKSRPLLMEAADILMFDVGAPEEIKDIWKTNPLNT